MKSSKKVNKELTIKECLTKLSKEELERLYNRIPQQIIDSLPKSERKSHIKVVEEVTKFSFSGTIDIMPMSELKQLKNVMEGKKIDEEKAKNLLISNYIFKIEDEYVVPKEIQDIYNEASLEDIKEKQFQMACHFYLLINGILSVKTLVELLEKTDIDITEEEILEYIEDNEDGYILDGDKIYLDALAIELDKKYSIYAINQNKKYASYSLLEFAMIESTINDSEQLDKVYEKIVNKINNNQFSEQIQTDIFEIILSGYNVEKEVISYLKEFEIRLTKKEEKEITQLLKETDNRFPTWKENGKIQAYETYVDVDDMLTEYIEAYILINGLMEIEKLQELLESYHNIKLSKEEIRFHALRINRVTITDNTIHIIDFPSDLLNKIKEEKEKTNKYKKIEDIGEMYRHLDEINENLEEIAHKYSVPREAIHNIITFMHIAGYNANLIEDVLNNHNIVLVDKAKKGLLTEIRNNTMELPVWVLNGYSKKEMTMKSDKVGRNDPCPCGSGKKYKQCCGK